MKFKTQKIAYWFFASAMLLLTLQILYGFIMGFARIGWDGLHDLIPFNTARATHTNLLVVWLLAGFMGSAYYIIPDECGEAISVARQNRVSKCDAERIAAFKRAAIFLWREIAFRRFGPGQAGDKRFTGAFGRGDRPLARVGRRLMPRLLPIIGAG